MPITPEALAQGLHYLRMDGRQVYRFATNAMADATQKAAEKAGWRLAEIDRVIPHQANERIIAAAAKKTGLPMDRFEVNLQEYGNTSAASVPIALCEAVKNGRVRPGDRLVLVGFGAGLTWASAAVRWRLPGDEVPAPRYRGAWRWGLYRWARLRSTARRAMRWLTVVFIRRAERR